MQPSTWDLKQTLAHERCAINALEESINHWKDITEDIEKGVSNIITTGNEWKIRYESQHQYNQMLRKQIQRLRAECRMLRCGVELSTDAEIKDLSTVGECRKLLRNLRVERWSLISLRKMYEGQLDIEALGYYRARDALDQLTKDVRNHQDTWIREQEKIDSEVLSSVEPSRSPRKLKPLAECASQKPVARIEPLKLLKMKRGEESYLERFCHDKKHKTKV